MTLPPLRHGQVPPTNHPESLGPDCHPTYQAVSAWGAIPSYELFMCKLTQGDHEINGAVTYASNAWAYRGLKWRYFGMYHWLEHDTPIDAQLKAFQAAILKVMKLESVQWGLPRSVMWMLDWERTENHPDPTYAMAEQFIAGMERWVMARGIVYAADWLPDFVQWRTRNPTYPLWYANYNLDPHNPRGGIAKCLLYRADMWQWSNHVPQPIGFKNIGDSMDMNCALNFDTLNHITWWDKPDIQPPTPPDVQPPQHTGDDEMSGYNNTEARPDPDGLVGQPGQNPDDTWPPGFIQWASVFDNTKWTKYHMGAVEFDGRVTVGKTNAQLDAIPDYKGMQVAPVVIPPIQVVGSFSGNAKAG